MSAPGTPRQSVYIRSTGFAGEELRPSRVITISWRTALAEWVHHRLLAAPVTGVRPRCLRCLRKWLVAHGDPSVAYDLGVLTLRMPLSHDLPVLRKRFPLYSDNLRRLTRVVGAKYPDLAVIDIGANVGDSVALVLSAVRANVLCVEGNARYLEFLRTNTALLPEVSIAPVFAGAATGELNASLHTVRGTGRLSVSDESSVVGATIPTVSLDSLLAQYPMKGRVKLLKSDTDGFEAVILASAMATLEQYRPVLFFEYDPYLLEPNGIRGLELLGALQGAGYRVVLLYDNVGDFVLALELNEKRHLEEIHDYFSGRRSERYLDVAAFHGEDYDIFEMFRETELEFFRRVRSGTPG